MKVLLTNYISQIEEIQNAQPWAGNSYRDILRKVILKDIYQNYL